MYKTIAVIAVCLTWCTATLIADEVYLVNGDRITGKITTLADGKLTVESDLAGKVIIDLNSVTTFNTKAPIEIKLKDGTDFKKLISKAETGKFAVEGDQTLTNQDFNVASIVAINPPLKELPKWQGDISAALDQHTRQCKYSSGIREHQSEKEKRNRPDAAKHYITFTASKRTRTPAKKKLHRTSGRRVENTITSLPKSFSVSSTQDTKKTR